MTAEGANEQVLVGIEIHQQLALSTKLFCSCPPIKTEEFPYKFERRLRPAQSETGRLDPAAVFEYAKGKSNVYFWSPASACLVEADEEPPHPLSTEGLDAALLVAKTLRSNVVDEAHVMRKIVIDGSNTGGFQRTVVIGLGGGFRVDGKEVGIQSVTLEEDAARIIGEDPESRRFALDRLGVALVEVALEPIRGDPEFVGRVALHLGRILRSTGMAARGLGTIRQDLNVSVSGGKVIEVKGVQKLTLVPKVVGYEIRRQRGLGLIAKELRKRGIKRVECSTRDITAQEAQSGSRVVRELVAAGGTTVCIKARDLSGLIGWEPIPGIRLGKELAEVARANSLGGIIHSDEFDRQGILEAEASRLRAKMEGSVKDAFVLVAGPAQDVERVVRLLVARVKGAIGGVPAETRAALDNGETRYMRPRPGSQRMYPETDIPDIEVTGETLKRLSKSVPKDWKERVEGLRKNYSLSEDMALKIYDSGLTDEYESLATELKLEPSFVASVLVDLPVRLSREGIPEEALGFDILSQLLRAVEVEKLAKELVPDVARAVGGKRKTVPEAIESMGLVAARESEVRNIVEAVISSRRELISQRGEGAFSPLMGEVMRELRGRADGALVSRVLKEALARSANQSNR